MKKFLLMIAALGSIATASADPSLVFGYCGDDINFTTGVNSAGGNGTIGGAIYIPEDLAEKWKGNSVSGVIVGFGTSSKPTIDLFISEGATYTASSQSYTMDTPVVAQSAEMELQNDWNEVTLNNPYTISGKAFYVGFNTPMLFGDRPLALDSNLTDASQEDNGDFIGINQEWVHGGPWFGRICLKLIVSGANLPAYDVSISDLFIPPFVEQNKPFASDFLIKNNGTETIENVTIEMSVDGKVFTTDTAVAEKPVAPGESAWLNATNLVCNIMGTDMNISASVVKVNGDENITITGGSTSGIMSCSDISYDKNVLIEEFTGTWCGFCPRGIVGMEYMQEHYGDKGFIPIAGHSGDEMQSTTYGQVVNTFSGGSFPSAVADRSYAFDPSAEKMEEYFLYIKQYPAFAQVNLEANYDASSNQINIDASSEFALDFNNATYALSFVLCQNNVGPYPQENYFAGGIYGPMGGWEKMGSVVAWTYNEVARYAISPFGISNSVPASIKKGQKYTMSTKMPAGSYPLTNCYLVGILLDTSTSRVVNSVKVNIGNAEAGVESLVAEPADGVYKVFNLQGVKVLETMDASEINSLAKGIYIVNGKKVMVR